MWDGGVHGRVRVGSGDGAGDAELWENVACFYGAALKKEGAGDCERLNEEG